MLHKDIEERVRGIILERVPKARKEALANNDELLSGGLLDSLGILDVVTILEKEFNITVADEDLVPEYFESIDRISAFIFKKSSVAESNTSKEC